MSDRKGKVWGNELRPGYDSEWAAWTVLSRLLLYDHDGRLRQTNPAQLCDSIRFCSAFYPCRLCLAFTFKTSRPSSLPIPSFVSLFCLLSIELLLRLV